MKTLSLRTLHVKIIFILFLCWLNPNLQAQYFQQVYGSVNPETITKVVADLNGLGYYALCSDYSNGGRYATVIGMDLKGTLQWSYELTFQSEWLDAIATPTGLMLVGRTYPADEFSSSLIGHINGPPNTTGASFSFIKTFDNYGRDAFLRIVQNGSDYLVAGIEIESSGAPTSIVDDVTLWKFDINGNVISKKMYLSPNDDEFIRDVINFPGGLIWAGNGTQKGLMYMTDFAGVMTTNAIEIDDRVYRDVEWTPTSIYAAVTDFNNTKYYIQKLDQNLLLDWEIQLQNIYAIHQIWEGAPGILYVTGLTFFSNYFGWALIQLNDNTITGPQINWIKYLHTPAPSNFEGGYAWKLPSNKLAFTDNRVIATANIGNGDAFLSVSDLDLNLACEVSTDTITFNQTFPVPNGPLLYADSTVNPPSPKDHINQYVAVDWKQDTVCMKDTCVCGLYEFWYSVGKGPLLPKNCGDTLHVPMNLPISFNSSFSCFGNCDSTYVNYWLTEPNGNINFTSGVSANPNFANPINASTFTQNGIYTFTVVGFCEGKACDTCTLYFAYPAECCKDQQNFIANFQNNVHVTVNNSQCKATLNIGNLPPCDSIEWIKWGDGSQTAGSFGANSMAMHTYNGSGVYAICYLAIEYNPSSGFICREKVICDTITLNCFKDTCCLNANNSTQVFLNHVNVTYVNNNNFCKATLNIGNLPACDRIDWIKWGDGSQTSNPPPNSMPMHTYSMGGPYQVCYLAVEINPATGFICFEKIICDSIKCTTATENVVDKRQFRLFPNPTSDLFTIQCNEITEFDGQIIIEDPCGRIISKKNFQHGQYEIQLSLEGLPSGVYFIKVLDDAVPIWNGKVIKQ